MKKILLLLVTAFFMFPAHAVKFELFYSPTCGHCHEAMKFLDASLKAEYPSVTFVYHNIAKSHESNLLKHYAAKFNLTQVGVPLVVVGDEFTQGFGPGTAQDYRNMLNKYVTAGETKTVGTADLTVPEEVAVVATDEIPDVKSNNTLYFLVLVAVVCAIVFLPKLRKKKS